MSEHVTIRADVGAKPSESASPWLVFAATFAVVVTVTLAVQRDAYFGVPIYETGDFAANALQIERAKNLAELVGNYSRWNFHHPGPAFFYVYALGEVVFRDLLRVAPAPHNAHLLAGMLVQMAFFAAGVAAAACLLLRRRMTAVVLMCAIALVHFRLAGDLQSTIWPPNVLIMPFFALVTSSIAMAAGRAWFMPVAVLAGSFLVHGHAGQPLLVLPIFAVAYALLARRLASQGLGTRAFVTRLAPQHLVAIAVAAPFISTLLADALRGPESNLGRILAASAFQWHAPADVAIYILAFLTYGAPAGVVSVEPGLRADYVASRLIPLAVVVVFVALSAVIVHLRARSHPRLREVRGPLRTYWGLSLLAAVLVIGWVAVQPGELFGFNSYFVFGLTFAALVPTALVLSLLPTDRVVRAIVPAVAIATIGGALALSPPSVPSDSPSARAIHASLPPVLAATDPGRSIYLDLDQLPLWFPAGAVALELERSGRSFEVSDGGPALIFGYDRIGRPDETPPPIRWVLVDPRQTGTYQYRLSDDLAIYVP